MFQHFYSFSYIPFSLIFNTFLLIKIRNLILQRKQKMKTNLLSTFWVNFFVCFEFFCKWWFFFRKIILNGQKCRKNWHFSTEKKSNFLCQISCSVNWLLLLYFSTHSIVKSFLIWFFWIGRNKTISLVQCLLHNSPLLSKNLWLYETIKNGKKQLHFWDQIYFLEVYVSLLWFEKNRIQLI